ncbi:hypothetical protein [Trichormus variabilis]|nr:hypothetical protein [Trichormus variabilis]
MTSHSIEMDIERGIKSRSVKVNIIILSYLEAIALSTFWAR